MSTSKACILSYFSIVPIICVLRTVEEADSTNFIMLNTSPTSNYCRQCFRVEVDPLADGKHSLRFLFIKLLHIVKDLDVNSYVKNIKKE